MKMSEAVNLGLITTAEAGDKVVKGLGVADVRASLQNFAWQDYTIFSFMLLICVIIGFYFGFYKAASSAQDYLVGGRTMQTLPIAMSLIASFVSGMALLGIPTEIYVYGIQYIYIIGGILLMAFIFERTFLPIFHRLQITSVYEYLELRFDKRTRCFAAILFAVEAVVWFPIVIYVPALAFNQVTGINLHIISPIICVICIIYTCIGGLKAVVWTDVIQTFIMLGSMVLVVSKATADVGGYGTVWIRNWQSGRIEGPNWDLNPLSRHTLWSLLLGGSVVWLQTGAVNQIMMQRYLSLPDFASARRALWLFIIGIVFVQSLCSYAGLVIYATYYRCDPLTTTLAREKDQLLPLLMMDVLGDMPGLPGLFVAGIFSAALSTLSTGLNSMAAVVLEDFYKTCFNNPLSKLHTQILMRATVVIFGAICLAMVFIMDKLGSIVQISMSVSAITNGASLAIFIMGALLPWATGIGAVVGGLSSISFMTWLYVRAQTGIISGDVYFPEKDVSTEGCHYQFTPKETPYMVLHLDANNTTHVVHTDETFMLYGLSYLWYTSLGALITISVGLLVSFIFNYNDPRDVDPTLLAPFVKELIKPREFPNQPGGNEIIYAYERAAVKITVPRRENVALEDINMPQSA